MTPPVVDRLFADPVLLRNFRNRRLIGLPQDRDHLLFVESGFLHGLPYRCWEPFSQSSCGPKNLGRSADSAEPMCLQFSLTTGPPGLNYEACYTPASAVTLL